MKEITYSADTDIGLQRIDNQDTFLACEIAFLGSNAVLLAAIDGVGGVPGGDIASGIAADCIKRYLDGYNLSPETSTEQALIVANNQIVREASENTENHQVGCCVATVCVIDQFKVLHYAHVGDTRLYLYQENHLMKISHDHSNVGMMEDPGEISEQEAMKHKDRNKINRMIGSDFHLRGDGFVECGSLPLTGEWQILLCSDGLTDQVKSSEIISVLRKDIAVDEKVCQLIQMANDKGGKDNVTVVVAKTESFAE